MREFEVITVPAGTRVNSVYANAVYVGEIRYDREYKTCHPDFFEYVRAHPELHVGTCFELTGNRILHDPHSPAFPVC